MKVKSFCPFKAAGEVLFSGASVLSFLARHTEPSGVASTAKEKNRNNQSGELATRVLHPPELPLPLQRIISEDLEKVEASKPNAASHPAEP